MLLQREGATGRVLEARAVKSRYESSGVAVISLLVDSARTDIHLFQIIDVRNDPNGVEALSVAIGELE